MKKRKRLCRKIISVLLCCLTVVSACLVVTYAEPEADPEIGADYQYPKAEVMQIDIVMEPHKFWEMAHLSVKSDEEIPREDAEIRKKYGALVSVNGSEFQKVDVRLRGSASLGDNITKPIKRLPFEICFDYSDPDSTLNGNPSLKLITCDSPANLFTELIAMETFRFMGIPTPFMTPAFVRINDQDFGMYLAVEDINADFVQKYYDGVGSLYSAKQVNDNDPIYVSPLFSVFKIKDDHGNDTIERMEKTAAQGKPIDSFLNIDQFLRFFACEAFIYDRDGIQAMHNFYLYDDHGRFEILPWDKDSVFQIFTVPDLSSLSRYESSIDNRLSPALSRATRSPENKELFYRYIQTLNNSFMDPSVFLPWLRQFIQAVCPYLQRDAAFSRKSNRIFEDLTTGQYLYNGVKGNLLLTFEKMHEQLQQQLQVETATYYIPPGCKFSNRIDFDEASSQDFRYGRQEARRICAGYWKLRRQFYWQEYGPAAVCIGSIFAVFFCIAIVSTHISKGGFRYRKKREDVWNE